MSATPPASQQKRRLLDRLAGSPTLLGENTRFVGDIESSGAFVLCGHLVGNGRLAGPLKLAASAHWEGHIEAGEAVIAGRITGSITVQAKLEISATAVIRGTVTAQTIAIARGAVVDGEIRVTGAAPILHFEEKRR